MFIPMTHTRLKELLEAAYMDGHEDGHAMGQEGEFIVDGQEGLVFAESVTHDEYEALLQRVRDGKPV